MLKAGAKLLYSTMSQLIDDILILAQRCQELLHSVETVHKGAVAEVARHDAGGLPELWALYVLVLSFGMAFLMGRAVGPKRHVCAFLVSLTLLGLSVMPLIEHCGLSDRCFPAFVSAMIIGLSAFVVGYGALLGQRMWQVDRD